MQRVHPLLGTVLLAAVTFACATATSVRIAGPRIDLDELVGEWAGTSRNLDTGREGSIWFSLARGEDHAHGNVVVTPARRTTGHMRDVPTAGGVQGPGRVLPIRFMVAWGNEVAGFLEAYWDPDCECGATTEYRGLLRDDTIVGTFVTRFQNGLIHTGRWTARRHRG
jgi:hypothetical protein